MFTLNCLVSWLFISCIFRMFSIYTPRSEDTMKKCNLYLILMKKFPGLVVTYGENLIKSLMLAEKAQSKY